VEPGGATTTFAYDDDDNRTTTTYPNGVTQSATYDAADRLTSIAGTKGSTTLTRFAYTYTKPGTVTDTALRHSVKDKANNTTTYTYDALDRLTRALTTNSSGATTADYAYGYDPAGNRTSESLNGTTTSATFNAANQLTSRGGVTYSYDANGNQTGSSEGQALVYNAVDQTTSLTKAGGSTLSATYAGPNQVERASAGATTFNNSLLGISAATTGTSSAGYTRDSDGSVVGLRGTDRSYYLFDGLGSVAAVTDSNGAVTNYYTYDPFGVTTETKALLTDVFNPWRYAGQYQDTTTGLYKMGARYYDPQLGRWTQADPSGQDANAYLYVGGNPVNFVDPSGLSFLDSFSNNGVVETFRGVFSIANLFGAAVFAGTQGGAATSRSLLAKYQPVQVQLSRKRRVSRRASGQRSTSVADSSPDQNALVRGRIKLLVYQAVLGLMLMAVLSVAIIAQSRNKPFAQRLPFIVAAIALGAVFRGVDEGNLSLFWFGLLITVIVLPSAPNVLRNVSSEPGDD
jgi:RHS repeat-associated protein